LPAPVTNVECQSRDMLAFWCTWQPGEDSLLDTQYRLQYRGLYSVSTWRDCPDYVTKGENSCHIPALSNSGLEQSINITATNALGSTWKLHRYNPNRSTIPHPPTNVRAEIMSPRQVQAQWDLPMEWQNYMSTYLSYKLRVWEEESPAARAENKWREIPSRQLIRRGRFIQASFHVIQNLKPGSEIRIQAASSTDSRDQGENAGQTGLCPSEWNYLH
ncbi:putative phosphatidylinositol phosphatase PTPRQ-like, partial [Apostichopus japonicus]